MIAGVADTHAALWYLFKNPRLSAAARSFMDSAASSGHDVALSPISLAEIVYLVQKGLLPESAYKELRQALNDPDFVIEEAPFTHEVVETMRQVPRADTPDMPDRIVAATALYFGVPIISGMAASVGWPHPFFQRANHLVKRPAHRGRLGRGGF